MEKSMPFLLALALAMSLGGAVQITESESATSLATNFTMTSPDSLPVDLEPTIEWSGQVFPNTNETFSFEGTAESIFHQIRVLNPDYDKYFDGDAECKDYNSIPYGNQFSLRYRCNKRRMARTKRVKQGIDYLACLTGICQFKPNRCSRVSCSHEAGIYYCYDGYGNYDLPHVEFPCTHLAHMAQGLMNICWDEDSVNFSGTAWDTLDTTLHIRWAPC